MPNGQFTFYSNGGCKGENQSVQLGSVTNMTIGGIGNVNAEFVKINTGVETYRWTAFIPAAYLVYRYHVPMEIIAAISYACGWILSIFVLGYFVYRHVNTKSMYMLILAVSQLLWIIWEVMDFSYYNIVFPDRLSGGKFDTYDASIQGAGNPYASWMQIAPLWILLMIIINTVPAFMITIRLLKNSEYLHEISTLTAICKVFKNNSIFAILVILQVINSIGYIICTCIQNYTEILGSDRNFLGLNGIIALLFAIHSAINCLFIEHIRVFLKLKTKFSSYKNLQQSIVIVPNAPTEPLSDEIPFRTRKRLSTIEEVCVFEEGAVDGLPQLF
ncbi:hypothetical protein HK103_001956 [Boothiomyces macroporosus]|uniref:Uncharacterized protein n=1 Tax=Boothiomyces macroporosus TaxID=261099 RepID=A0AAD5UM66_9FUNG|nr:hypothetical protein HK103_001956 [Boothiomyces macroporosus]